MLSDAGGPPERGLEPPGTLSAVPACPALAAPVRVPASLSDHFK